MNMDKETERLMDLGIGIYSPLSWKEWQKQELVPSTTEEKAAVLALGKARDNANKKEAQELSNKKAL